MDLFLICSDAALQVAKSVQEVGVEVKTNEKCFFDFPAKEIPL